MKSPYPPIVMVPGLASVMLTFKNVLIGLTRHFVVHYVETREKSSSILPAHADLSVNAIGMDIVKVIARLELTERNYIIYSASLGATATIECFPSLEKKPLCLVVLEPNAVFDYPQWSLMLIRCFAPFLYPLIKPGAKWYLKHFRTNYKQDIEMYRINSRALDAADPSKLKKAVLAISGYQMGEQPCRISCPVLIVCATKDTFHRHADIQFIASSIKQNTLLDLEIHERTHSSEFVNNLRDYISTLPGYAVQSKTKSEA